MKLVYSGEAVADLVRLRAFIAENDPSAASRVAQELITRIEILCHFPYMGHGVEHSPHAGALAGLRIWHHYEGRE